MLNLPANISQHFANLAFSAATRIANRRDSNPEYIFYNLPEFGGDGSTWQLQTENDNYADLTESELRKVAADGFEFEGKYYGFIYQD